MELNAPRSLLKPEKLKKNIQFYVHDISSIFSEYLRRNNSSVLFVIDSIYDHIVDDETMKTSETETYYNIPIGGKDLFPENRSLTISSKKVESSENKIYIPLGVVYSGDIENDKLLGILPTYVEIINARGAKIQPRVMTVGSNGLVFVDYTSEIPVASITITYGKPSYTNIVKYLNISDQQLAHTGYSLPNMDPPLSDTESTFANVILKSKPKGEKSNLSKEERLNRIMKYMKEQYLRYSIFDTIDEKDGLPNFRRAVKRIRTSCLGAACVAKSFLDTAKFSKVDKSGMRIKSGILTGMVFNLHGARKDNEGKYPVSLLEAHAVTLAKIDDKVRVYDITPIKLFENFKKRIFETVSNYNQNTSALFFAIKQLCVESDHSQFLGEYRKARDANWIIAKSVLDDDYLRSAPVLKRFFREYLLSVTNISCRMKFNFPVPSTTLSGLKSTIGFPFSNIYKASISLEGKWTRNELLARKTKSSVGDIKNLKSYLNELTVKFNVSESEDHPYSPKTLLKGLNKLGKYLPISRTGLEIFSSLLKAKAGGSDLLRTISGFQENLKLEYTEAAAELDKVKSAPDRLIDVLREDSSIEIDLEQFSKIPWLELVFGQDRRLLGSYASDYYNVFDRGVGSIVHWEDPTDLPKTILEVKSKARNMLMESVRLFNLFLDDKKQEIMQIFKQHLNDRLPPNETTVSSTLLWKNFDKRQSRETDESHKDLTYLKIRDSLSKLFSDFYSEYQKDKKETFF